MNLIEVVLAAALFSLSAGASLHIWSLTSLGVMQEDRRQLLADRLDGEVAAVEASLRHQARSSLPLPACGGSAASLQTVLASRVPASGVQRALRLLPAEDSLLLELAIEGLPMRRQRLLVPAALGLCLPAVPAAQGHG